MEKHSPFMTPEEVEKHWEYIRASSQEFESWPEWKKQSFSVNYRTESLQKQPKLASIDTKEPSTIILEK